MPFNDNTFDSLICFHVLEHIVGFEKAIKEINRVLRPGGVAFLGVPISDYLNNWNDEQFPSDQCQNI